MDDCEEDRCWIIRASDAIFRLFGCRGFPHSDRTHESQSSHHAHPPAIPFDKLLPIPLADVKHHLPSVADSHPFPDVVALASGAEDTLPSRPEPIQATQSRSHRARGEVSRGQ